MGKKGICIYYRNEYCAVDSNECLLHDGEFEPDILALPEKYCNAVRKNGAVDLRDYENFTDFRDSGEGRTKSIRSGKVWAEYL